MVRMILSGANGAMGRVIARSAAGREDCAVVAGIDPNTDMPGGFPVFARPDECSVEADVVVDFSHPSALTGLLAYCVARRLPLVVATTGLNADHRAMIRTASEQTAIFHSANMSLGVNLVLELCKTAARVLGRDFDIEIIEKHHNRKLDSPSGTALMLADGISEALAAEPQYIYDRHSRRKARDKSEIGIHGVRGGTIVGEHEVLFAGQDEIVTIAHSASSKEIFATGAINAALFLRGKAPGLYNMKDLI